MSNKIFQVATLQSLILGYFKKVIDVDELLKHGNIGLGTYSLKQASNNDIKAVEQANE